MTDEQTNVEIAEIQVRLEALEEKWAVLIEDDGLLRYKLMRELELRTALGLVIHEMLEHVNDPDLLAEKLMTLQASQAMKTLRAAEPSVAADVLQLLDGLIQRLQKRP